MRPGGQPIIVLSQGTKRESGHQVQIGNITACKVRNYTLEFFKFLIFSFFYISKKRIKDSGIGFQTVKKQKAEYPINSFYLRVF